MLSDGLICARRRRCHGYGGVLAREGGAPVVNARLREFYGCCIVHQGVADSAWLGWSLMRSSMSPEPSLFPSACYPSIAVRIKPGAFVPSSRGVCLPNNHGALFPPFSRLPFPFPPRPPPQTIFGHCVRNVVQFMRVFSEFWKLSVMDNDPSKTKEYKWSW